MIYFNSRSVKNKLRDLFFLINSKKPDIVCICETWLNNNINDAELVQGLPYNVFRSDRKNKRGGGVAIIVKDNVLVCHSKSVSVVDLCEYQLVDFLDPQTQNSLRLICLYRPPWSNSQSFDLFLDMFSDLITTSQDIVVVGDLNLNCNWAQLPTSMAKYDTQSKLFLNFIINNNIHQLINVPTRFNAYLDLLFVNDRDIVDNIVVKSPFSTSDHNIIECKIKFQKTILKREPVFNYFRTDFEKVEIVLKRVNWDEIFLNFVNVDDLCSRFSNVLMKIVNEHTPQVIYRTSYNKFPQHIVNLFEQKQRLFAQLGAESSPYKKFANI